MALSRLTRRFIVSSTNDVTKVSASSAIESLNRKDKEKKIEVGLTAAVGAGVATVAGMEAAKRTKKPKKSLSIKKAIAEKKLSKLLDDPDIPLTPELQKQYEGAKKSRKAIMKYKLNRIDDNRTVDRMNKIRGKWKPGKVTKGNSVPYMAQGIDVIGEEAGGMFVKEAKPDSIYKKDMTPKNRKRYGMARGGYRGEPIKDSRKRIINRILMQESLGDAGVDTHFYRKGKGKPVTMAQELLSVPKSDTAPTPKMYQDRNRVMGAMRDKGLIPEDMHFGNIGYDVQGNPKPIDLGHSAAGDYERFTGEKKLRKALDTKNVASKTNKRLYSKMAKKAAKRLPSVLGPLGWLATAAGIAMAPNKAEAALLAGIDAGSAGVMAPSDIGGGDLPPQELAKRKAYNAKMRLQQAQKMKQLRSRK